MEGMVLEIILAILGGLLSALIGWGISLAKKHFGLSPQFVKTLNQWEQKIVDWVVDKAEEQGKDLSIPDTRWALVNEAVDAFVDYIPMVMDAVGYTKEDVATEVERAIKKFLKENVSG